MNIFESFRCVIFLIFLRSCQSERSEDENCEIGGVVGECVPLPACAQLVSLLKNSSTTEEGLTTTRERKCGYQGNNVKVCCRSDEKYPIILRKGLEEDENPTESDLYVGALPDHGTCGWADIKRSRATVRILTKKEVASGEHHVINNGLPVLSRDMSRYMALLGYYSVDAAVLWKCGGSVITEKHVLTAAHCITDYLYIVRVGELDLALEEKDAGPVDYYIKKKIPHEQYEKFHNDIGILLLDGTINFKKEHHIGPICLPYDTIEKKLTKYGPVRGQNVGIIIAGWGDAPELQTRPTWLSFTNVDIIKDNKCKKLYESSSRIIDQRVFCAGERQLRHDACNGDSGGPLAAEYWVPEYNRTFFYQLGIISYGFRCSAHSFTGVYTNVTHFLPWIQQKVLADALSKP